MKRSMRALLAAAAAAVLVLGSCQTTGVTETPDQKATREGVAAWNNSAPSAAERYWSAIKDPAAHDAYIGYLRTFEDGSRALQEAGTLKPSEEERILADYQKAQGKLSTLPAELPLPAETRATALALAEGRVRALISAGKLSPARVMGKTAIGTFGESAAITQLLAGIDVIQASRVREAAVDSSLEKARDVEAFDEKVAAYDSTVSAFRKTEGLLADDAARAGVGNEPAVAREAARLKKKRQDAAIEKDGMVRERAYQLKERIGEEFARAPESKTVGTMTLEEVLAHEESVKSAVEAAYEALEQFAARYPRTVDQEMIDEVEVQKKDLDAKISQVTAEIRTAREIASRGKIAMPVMIGLFNPQPGASKDAKKSRPAKFGAAGVKKSDYWWGMVSINPGAMNDLVVTVSDGRTVRVFAENTRSGALAEKNGNRDLVNRGSRVGNSWPVLNAGRQLSSDKYFFEVGPGASADYTGEVVIYSSFVTRMR
jgi:hypothetical protein